MYRIEKSTTNQITVLKSIFICTLFPITGEEEVKMHLKEIKKKYFDARHHVYAYIIGNNGENKKCSDDGEPAKTAGAPILTILEKKELTNILAIVTRYFGGTLLGTGGLVRAYSSAVIETLKDCDFIELIETNRLTVLCSYKDYQAILNLNYPIINAHFTTDVYLEIEIPKKNSLEIIQTISMATNGAATIHVIAEPVESDI